TGWNQRATRTQALQWIDFGDRLQVSRRITVAERLSYVGDVAPRLACLSALAVKPRSLTRSFGARSVGSDPRRFLQLCVLLLTLFHAAPIFAQATQKVRIADRIWGFDGRVMSGQFMPLSIEIDNLSDEPIEAQATLRSVAGMMRETGGTATQSVFLSPHSRRWVQFYPYVVGMTTSWRFELRTETETFTFVPIDQPRSVVDSNSLQMKDSDQSLTAVILDRPDALIKIPATIKHMPEEIFPPYATATHGLCALFMDHVPDWETPRQEAMLSWLKAGGRLHLLHDQNNQILRFSGPLAALNEPFPEFHVGSGSVTRHEIQRAQLTKDIVATAVMPQSLSKADLDEIEQYNQQAGGGFSFGTSSTDDDELFAELRQLTQPDHLWWLIFLLSLCYVGLIFPGCWILSRQRTLHFLVTYGSIAGLAAIFSLMFLFIGRRGYGEATSLHSVAIARAEDDTHSSLLQLTTLFVTEGNTYSVTDKDRQTLLASGASEESVDARITSGNTASFVSRIPPYSSQAIRSRRRIETDDWNLAVTSLNQQGDELKELTIAFGKKFPNDPLVECMVIHGRNLHHTQIDRRRGQLKLTSGRQLLRSYCTPADSYMAVPSMLQTIAEPEQEPKDPVEASFKRMLPDLVRRSLVDDFVQDVAKFRLPEDRIRLLVYAPMTDTQHLGIDADIRRVGRILYVRDLFLNPRDQGINVDPAEK
ncbi:MAG: hypothetical protein H7Z17_14235, partial [Fuerstia sp.]|nr:hypothetical protein [Fuerstiella sp.]